MQSPSKFFESAINQNHPLRSVLTFLTEEKANKDAGFYEKLRFVGYPLDVGYDTVRIMTSDPFKIIVGGVPKNSLLIMVPENFERNMHTPHFILLRVSSAAETPLKKEMQQTVFELHKRSMPEIDRFTQNEIQWSGLDTAVLGMFYPNPDPGHADDVEFSSDMKNFISAHKYLVYVPSEEILDLIVNCLVPKENRFELGKLRLTECRMLGPDQKEMVTSAYVSTKDLMGTRTALFGKTRLGKSNIVKLIAASLIETTRETKNVGQVIFDLEGEYANDNPQDNKISLRTVYSDNCEVYALNPKAATKSKPLKLNFYENPDTSHRVLSELLMIEGRDTSNYIRNFISVDVPSLGKLSDDENERKRQSRRILMYWAILYRAGYQVDEKELGDKLRLDPHYNSKLRNAVWEEGPPGINSLEDVATEFEQIAKYIQKNGEDDEHLLSSSGSNKSLFDADDLALLNFLAPKFGTGARVIQPYREYHDKKAGDFINEIIGFLEEGKTIILDLGNANPEIMKYYSHELSNQIFKHQVNKFSNNALGDKYVQLYFEEAHNLFPKKEDDGEEIYRRIAKEGAKYHIGMVYSTQTVTSINTDLLNQTENFFIAHLSSQDEVKALGKVNVAYEGLENDILRNRTVGYVRMLTRSHRFVIPIQANQFGKKTAS